MNSMDAAFEFFFEEEHIILRDTIREFVKKEFPPDYIRKMDHEKKFPFDVVEKLKKLKLTGVGLSEEYGGLPSNFRGMFLAMEELAKASPALCFIAGMMGQWGGYPISLFGTKELKDFFLPKIIDGELIFSLAMTEAGGGSDLLGNIRTVAEEKGDEFIITGEKVFITGAHVADYIMVLAKTNPEEKKQSKRFSLIIVDAKNTPGIEISPIDKIVIQSVGSNIVAFDNVRVPKKNLLGNKGEGYIHLIPLLSGHKLLAAADAIGVAEAAYSEAMEYAKLRKAFDNPIAKYQLIQKYLVDMESDIRAAKNLGYQAAYLADHNKSWIMEAIIAERFASEICFKTTTNAMTIFGGYGLTRDYNLERYWRDSRQFITTPFTNEIAISQIATLMGLPASH